MTEKDEDQLVREEIVQAIKEKTDLKQKVKLCALNFYLEKKKELDKELEEKIKELTVLYEGKSAPFYRETNKLINGERAPVEDELKDINDFLNDEERSKRNEGLSSDPISGYWFNCLKNCGMINTEIKDKDEQVLQHLLQVEHTQINDKTFELTFTFDKANDHFSNEILKKTITVKDQDEPVKSVGTHIDWKEGKNLTKKTVKKTQKNKKSGQKRVVTKEVEDESFFNFFSTVNIEDSDKDNLDEEEQAKQEERIGIDYDIARTIIDEIIPYSLEYFLGVKQDEEDDYDDVDDDDEDDDGQDGDDDDEEEDEPKAKKSKDKGKGKKSKDSTGAAPEGQQAEEQPECQQQ